MSEFFKALEQAERDRVRQEQVDVASAPPAPPASRTTVRENGAREKGTRGSEPVAAKPAVVKPVVAKPAAAKPVVPPQPITPPQVVPPAAPETTAAKPLVAEPTPPPPSVAPSPAGVFRPSLRTPERSRITGRIAGRQPLLVAQTHPNSIEADAYRTVRANIELMSEDGPFRRIAITSASGGDGKSTTAANLAVVAAQGGRRVCLVDADLRRPTLHDVFGLPNVDGLTYALEHGKPLHTVARTVDLENLSVVVAGRGADETFHDRLTAQRLEKILKESEAAFDLVVLDSPPVISVADALSVAAVSDGVILVVRAGSIPFNVVRRAIGQVEQVKGRVLGVLLNQVNLRATDADSYRYYRAYHATRSKS